MKLAYRAVLGVVSLATAGAAMAQATNTATADASITITRGITVTKNADLAFGRCVQPTVAGTVAVAAATGARTTTNVTCPTQYSDTVAAAAFTVNGEGGAAITVTVPPDVTMNNGGDSILVTLAAGTLPTSLSGTAGAPGSATFNVGGSAALGAAQAAGPYTGTFMVTAAYN